MKFRYIIAALILCLAVGCQEEPLRTLSEIQVSESYLAIDVNGGSAYLDVTTTAAWNVNPASVPAWLTVSPMSGNAGTTRVTFSAEATKSTNAAEVVLTASGQNQFVNVIQYAAKGEVKVMSVAEALALIKTVDKGDGQSYNVDGEYCVKGIITKIDEVDTGSYGNATYYISDDGKHQNWLEVYRGYWLNNAKFTSKDAIAVGDEVTIMGQLMSYKGTPETVQNTAYIVSIEKSLISVASIDPEDATIPSEGGEVSITLTNKGNGIFAEVPEAAKSWLSIASIAGNTVTFHASENFAGPRNATLTFKTTDGKKDYSTEASVIQLGATGSMALPFTVTEAIEYALTLDAETEKDFYVKGIISKIEPDKNGDPQVFGSYGNATFWISEDGVYNDDKSLDFEAYRVLWLDNQKWEEGNAQIAVGAEVILCGKLTQYNGTAETSGNKAYVYQINGVTSEAEGIGTLESPFTALGAIEAAQSGIASNVFVAGKISKIVDGGEFGSYGNATFWISSDGVFNNDLTKDFEAYRVLYLGNRKWADGDAQIAVGDNVILHGALTTYKGTSETVQNKAYIYSLNGVTE